MTGHMDPGPPFRWFRSLIFFCIGLAVMACGPSEPVKIGFVGGISGRVADLGIAGRDAVQLAVDLRNQAGGINGREIRLLVKNDEHNPEVARRVVGELIEQGVSAIVGPMTSVVAVAVAPVVTEARVLLVSPTATTEELSGIDDYFFRITNATKVFASANANYQVKTKRMLRAAAIFDVGNRAFSELWLKHFTEAFERGGGKILTRLEFTSGQDTQYFQAARKMLEADPDGVIIVANAMDSAILCQQIRKLDQKIPITLADWGATETLLEMGGRAVEGVVVVQTFDRNKTTPRYDQFRRLYQKRFGREPGFPGVHGFEAASVVLDALQNRVEGGDLKQAVLHQRKYHGMQNDFAFDDFGDVKRAQVSMSVVRNAKFVVIE